MADISFTNEELRASPNESFASRVLAKIDPQRQSATVQVGKCNYTVSRVNDKLSVSRNFNFLDWICFRRNNSKTILGKLCETVNRATIGKNLSDTVKNTFANVSGPERVSKTVAFFGEQGFVQDARQRILSATDASKVVMHVHSIDDFNEALGLRSEEIDYIKGLPEVCKVYGTEETALDEPVTKEAKAHSRVDPYSSAGQLQRAVGSEKIDAWKAYLGKHADKLNILNKINVFLQKGALGKKATGWAGLVHAKGAKHAMESFVRKNLSADDLSCMNQEEIPTTVAFLAAKLKSLAEVYATKEKVTDQDLVDLGIRAPNNRFNFNETLLRHVVQNAFNRQMTKLGIDFFKEQGIPMVFLWADRKGTELEGSTMDTEAKKWWKKPVSKTKTGQVCTIAETALRHAYRTEKKADRPAEGDEIPAFIHVKGGLN